VTAVAPEGVLTGVLITAAVLDGVVLAGVAVAEAALEGVLAGVVGAAVLKGVPAADAIWSCSPEGAKLQEKYHTQIIPN
jgi:hypothetical protein